MKVKKYFPLFLVAILAALFLAACGTPIADEVVKDVVVPPTAPTMGDPIELSVGQPVEISNGETTLTLEYLGKDSSGFFQWTCLDDQGKSCAERHSNSQDMKFYYDFTLIGETVEDSFSLASDWEVKLYP